MKRTLFLLCFNLFFLSLIAQTNNDSFYVNYNYFPGREMQNFDGKADYSQVEANAILPTAKFGRRVEFYTVVNYKYANYDYDNNELFYLPDQLHDFRVGIIFRYLFGPNFEGILSPRMNARTDFEEKFGSKDLFPSAYMLLIRKSASIKNLSFGIGVSYNNDLNRNSILPLGYLKYKNSWMRAYAILPSFAYVLMTPNPRVEYGLAYNLDASIFHTESIITTDTPNYLRTRNITISPTFSYNFADVFWVNTKIGYALPGDYEFLDANFDAVDFSKDNHFKSGIFLNLGVSLRISK